MVYFKIKKILLILLCIFVLIFPFWCVAGLCVEQEEVAFSIVEGLNIRENANYFQSSSNSVGYFALEKGYIYHIHNLASGDKKLAISNEIPVLNGTYQFLGLLGPDEIYDYIVTDNDSYIYFDFYASSNVEVTREKLASMDGAVEDLVDNVGPSAIWNIFDVSINYIYIVILVAFGIFIVTLVIKKITKGKEGF